MCKQLQILLLCDRKLISDKFGPHQPQGGFSSHPSVLGLSPLLTSNELEINP